MCLVSKTMRSLAVEHLFSSIRFGCEQDLSFWETMVPRTPRLQTIVKKVTFCETGFEDEDWIMRDPAVYSPRRRLREAVVPPQISPMPNVRIVEWEGDSDMYLAVPMAVAYMSLFPNVEALGLDYITFDGLDEAAKLLGACGRLKVLSTFNTNARVKTLCSTVGQEISPFDFTALEELTIDFYTCLLPLVTSSSPAGLLSFRYVNFGIDDDIQAAETVLQHAASSLTNLDLAMAPSSTFDDPDDLRLMVELFGRLPALPALRTLALSVTQAEPILNESTAPALITLILRIPLLFFGSVELDCAIFDEILQTFLPWGGRSESMRSALTHKFPLLRRITFHFCVAQQSPIHFRRGLRRRVERQLMKRLEETGADIAELVELDWLDDDYDPVVYSKTSGKPPWKLAPGTLEPETEASDCGIQSM
ncbi:hypothetical protein DFH06DRAFT_1294162 [Mycena polygramma]|nr:hypothetical protein DFH06DRAFT_1294162 [Mycena polygramma]